MPIRLIGLVGLLLALTAALAAGLWPDQPGNVKPRFELPSPQALVTIAPKEEVTTPGPLRARRNQPAAALTHAGVLAETNRQRASQGLPAYSANPKLNAAANAKLQDMLARQYFEHIGPDGRGPADWVDDASYTYIAVGENLAVGSFAGNAELVAAWMASPGHRANILHPSFVEIGISVAEGNFEGETTWLAVQTFATPASACPSPGATLQTQFNQQKAEAAALEGKLDVEKAKLDDLIEKFESGQGTHEQVIAQQDTYNTLINQFNTLNNELISLADQLNQQINAYNDCIARFSS